MGQRIALAASGQPGLEQLFDGLLHVKAEHLVRPALCSSMSCTSLRSRSAARTNAWAHLRSLIEHTAFAKGARKNVVQRVLPVLDVRGAVHEDVLANAHSRERLVQTGLLSQP